MIRAIKKAFWIVANVAVVVAFCMAVLPVLLAVRVASDIAAKKEI